MAVWAMGIAFQNELLNECSLLALEQICGALKNKAASALCKAGEVPTIS
jgi:hypothetical protein